MKLMDAHALLLGMNQPVFQTGDAAARLGIANAHASKVLARLAASGHVARLSRALWAFPEQVDPLALPACLTAPFPSYVSLQSALYFHGMISQVPAVTYAVSLARTRRFKTPLGGVSIHHVNPAFFFGFEDAGRRGARIATPEKALVDFLYLGPAKTKLFRALPEVEFPRGFRVSVARRFIDAIRGPGRRTHVRRSFERLLSAQHAGRGSARRGRATS